MDSAITNQIILNTKFTDLWSFKILIKNVLRITYYFSFGYITSVMIPFKVIPHILPIKREYKRHTIQILN